MWQLEAEPAMPAWRDSDALLDDIAGGFPDQGAIGEDPYLAACRSSIEKGTYGGLVVGIGSLRVAGGPGIDGMSRDPRDQFGGQPHLTRRHCRRPFRRRDGQCRGGAGADHGVGPPAPAGAEFGSDQPNEMPI